MLNVKRESSKLHKPLDGSNNTAGRSLFYDIP